jgi:hypothetical protein
MAHQHFPFAIAPTLETRFATSLSNNQDETRAVVLQAAHIAERMTWAAAESDWTKVQALALRLESLTYRAKLDARLHAIFQEG